MIERALWFLKHWVYMAIFGRETPEQLRAFKILSARPQVRYRWTMRVVKDGQPVGEPIPMDREES